MKPDPSTPSQQGTGTKRDKSRLTVPEDAIPAENRRLANVDEGPTEGALPPGEREPRTSGIEDRPSRGINRGLHP